MATIPHRPTFVQMVYLKITIMMHNKCCSISTAGSWEDRLVLFSFARRIKMWKVNDNRQTTDANSDTKISL